MQRLLILVCALAATTMVDAKNQFPSYVKKCSRKNIEPCVMENIEIIRPHLKKGVPRLSLASFDPFYIPEISMDNNNLKVTVKNLKIHHLDEVVFEDLKVDLDNNKLSTRMKFPRMVMDGDYSMQGKILILQLNGKGKSYMNMTNFVVDLKISGERFQKNGAEYIKYADKDIKLSYDGDLYMYFFDLFGSREELTVNTNAVINEAGKEFIRELEPIVKSAVEALVESSLGNIFLKFSLKELFDD